MAPPFDFLALTLLPLLGRMGARVEARLERHGFYPAGGGRFTLTIEPGARLTPLALLERGDVTASVRSLVAMLPERIARQELGLVRQRLGLERPQASVETIAASAGPGNALMIELRSAEVTELVTAFGIKGVHATEVARLAADEAAEYLEVGVPVGRHLADQLLVPMALAEAARFARCRRRATRRRTPRLSDSSWTYRSASSMKDRVRICIQIGNVT
jgi:RNA 3'-terminal phosphate cyclase (ATP)